MVLSSPEWDVAPLNIPIKFIRTLITDGRAVKVAVATAATPAPDIENFSSSVNLVSL
ncbi:hypothetical protein MOS_577 [Mesomycoplasma hyorhinis SK76]|uniref:Uncharacterized protein n=1 Tax=Mesomycoplasma hyorhinis SK76 TaxID=1118964 RepID=A0AAI8AND2_MESHY|nr:hypothetical protein MOS_577 [Mesomycoplasma hyorhinis SK76]